MDIAFKQQLESNLNILPLKTKKAFIFLSKQSWLNQSDWYLAGRTALAIQAKHRKSLDLDFFTKKKKFDNLELLSNFFEN